MGPAPHLLLQLAVILVAARVLAWLLQRLGQPPVIGEMLAGFALGPVVLGALAPGVHEALFPPASLPALEALSQFGLVLFMFLVGAGLRLPAGVRSRLAVAGWTGSLGVALPMALGLAIAPYLYAHHAPAGVAAWPFALFIAASMAVTAVPVLARLLGDTGMAQTRIGQVALAGAAVADALAWVALALVLAVLGAAGGWAAFARTAGGLLLLAAACLGVLRPLLARWLLRHAPDGRPGAALFGLLLALACTAAAATQWLGLHALFGAFLFGACLPRDDRLCASLHARLEPVAVLLLMPVFFAMAGLHATPDVFAAASLPALGLVLAAAVLGKLAGAGGGARLGGLGWREALAVGALMNARGLMELVVLQVGLDAGVIGNAVFTLLLVMAIATTLMATPLMRLCRRGTQGAAPVPATTMPTIASATPNP
jgi:Kef-type K+ transport system membrane component KefB